MKTYIKPLTDIVILNTFSDTMDVNGEPNGSYNVKEWNKDEDYIIGGDDANTFNFSLWDEE